MAVRVGGDDRGAPPPPDATPSKSIDLVLDEVEDVAEEQEAPAVGVSTKRGTTV